MSKFQTASNQPLILPYEPLGTEAIKSWLEEQLKYPTPFNHLLEGKWNPGGGEDVFNLQENFKRSAAYAVRKYGQQSGH